MNMIQRLKQLLTLCFLLLMTQALPAQTKKPVKKSSPKKTSVKKTSTSTKTSVKSAPKVEEKKTEEVKPETQQRKASPPPTPPPSPSVKASDEKTGPKKASIEFQNNLNEALTFELGLGATASFVGGRRIQEFEKLYELRNANQEVSTQTSPLFFGKVGVYASYRPIKNTELAKLAIGIGLEYFKRGFTQKYTLQNSYTGYDIKETTHYQERYNLNMLSIPLRIRYGQKAFVQMGLSYNKLLYANKKTKLNQTQEGSAAFNGGFDITEKDKFNLKNAGIRNTSINFNLGLGLHLNKRTSMQVGAMKIGKNFSTGYDFKNYILHLQINKQLNLLP